MRIGINALYYVPGELGGTATYLENLLAALAAIDHENRYFVFANLETGRDIVPVAENFMLVRQRVRSAIRPARILWEQCVLPFETQRLQLDVLLNAGYTAPVLCGCPQATVFHDLQYRRHPEYFRWFDLPFWRMLLFWAAHVSRVVIAVSPAVKQDLLRYYRLPADKVHVTQLGVSEDFFRIRRSACREAPYLLSISMLHPHKNLDGLLRVFRRFHVLRPEFRLVIAGPRGFYERELLALRESLGLVDAVRFTGWIPRGELMSLIAGAAVFVYPSRFEGFGLPLLEAMAAAVPAACSDIEPLRSIAGEAALLFDPGDEAAMLDAIVRLTSDEELRCRLAREGPRRAKEFSWQTTARATLDAIAQARGS